MHPAQVDMVRDEKDLPAVYQCYLIPTEFRGFTDNKVHDNAVFSLWNHV